MSYKANISAATQGTGNVVQDFTTFLQESTILETATAIIIGNAFKGIVDSFVGDVLTPILSLLTSKSQRLEDLYIVIGEDTTFDTLGNAEEKRAKILRYGLFLKGILNFILQALVVFFIIRTWVKLKKLGTLIPKRI
jgi:large conductance mechanosensitive channel